MTKSAKLCWVDVVGAIGLLGGVACADLNGASSHHASVIPVSVERAVVPRARAADAGLVALRGAPTGWEDEPSTAAPARSRSLIRVVDEPQGTHCPRGGFRFDRGLDANDDGDLAPNEITATSYDCAPADVD